MPELPGDAGRGARDRAGRASVTAMPSFAAALSRAPSRSDTRRYGGASEISCSPNVIWSVPIASRATVESICSVMSISSRYSL